MNPMRWSFRAQFLLGFLICVAVLAYAIFLQLQRGLEPCPKCIFQRIAFAAMGMVFLVGGLHAPAAAWGRRAYAVLASLAGLIGAGIAARHSWVQLHPDPMASCGPPLAFLRQTMGPFEVLRSVLTGTGDCGAIDWQFLGLTMPMWSLLCFLGLSLWALLAGFASRRRRLLG